MSLTDRTMTLHCRRWASCVLSAGRARERERDVHARHVRSARINSSVPQKPRIPPLHGLRIFSGLGLAASAQ
jgi:hypothetical protein